MLAQLRSEKLQVALMVGARLKLIPLTEAVPEVIVGAAWKGETAPPLVERFIAAAAAVPPEDPA